VEAKRVILLKIEGVVKQFSGITALNGIDLHVDQGQTLGIIGPNGAGKTTLFNVISGILRPEKGRVIFRGADLVGLMSHEICSKGLGRTFQIVQPFSRLTVLDNVAAGCLFGMRARTRVSSLKAAREMAAGLLSLGRLDGRENRLAETLTLSERKRLEMIRALATGSDLILLDEVMAGLTPTETQEMVGIIKEFRERLGLTLLIIEHNVRLVMGLSHRIVVLNYGEIIANASPETIIRDPVVIKAYLGEHWAKRHCGA
jgi:branched-chain amino acid transport system ATP-binding protein